MANKFGVLDAHQNAAVDVPARYVKRVVAQYLLAKQMAVRVGEYLIQIVAKKAKLSHSDPARFLRPDLPFADHEYPAWLFDETLASIPGMAYPRLLAPHDY